MASPSDNDPYVDPASGVLLNLAGIRDAMALERFEAEMSVMRQMELSRHLPGGDFDLPGRLAEYLGEINPKVFQ